MTAVNLAQIWRVVGLLITSGMFVISASLHVLYVPRHRLLLPKMLKIKFKISGFIIFSPWMTHVILWHIWFLCAFFFAIKFHKNIVCFIFVSMLVLIWLIVYLNFAFVTLDTYIHVELELRVCSYNCSVPMLQQIKENEKPHYSLQWYKNPPHTIQKSS